MFSIIPLQNELVKYYLLDKYFKQHWLKQYF